jgi:hypothetical protein
LKTTILLRALPLSLVMMMPAAASPLNPWGVHVGKGSKFLTPFLYVDQGVSLYPYVYGQYGISDQMEILVGAGATVGKASSFDSIEVMPRYFFTDEHGVVLHAFIYPGGGAALGPEYHGVMETGPITLTVNAGWRPTLNNGFSAGSAFAMVAPEYYITEGTSVFLEVDPSMLLVDVPGLEAKDKISLTVVPGVSTVFAEKHYVALGIQVPVMPGFDTKAISAGAWYSVALGG